jgi:hypothetical protein
MKKMMIVLVAFVGFQSVLSAQPLAWVAITDPGEKDAPRRAVLRAGQQIVTAGSQAEIHFGAFGLLRLKENSDLEIRMLDLGVRHSRVQLKLNKGQALMWMGAKKSGRSQFLLSTPAAVVSGQSAAVVVEVENRGSTIVKVIDGSVKAADLVEENERGEAVEGNHIDVPSRHQLVWEDGIPAETPEAIPLKELEAEINWANEPEIPELLGKKKRAAQAETPPEVKELKRIVPH